MSSVRSWNSKAGCWWNRSRRVLLETLGALLSAAEFVYSVRAAPIINDATAAVILSSGVKNVRCLLLVIAQDKPLAAQGLLAQAQVPQRIDQPSDL